MSRQTTNSLIVVAVVGIWSIALIWNDASAYYYLGGYHHDGYGTDIIVVATHPNPSCY
jgi:hypothetical protein